MSRFGSTMFFLDILRRVLVRLKIQFPSKTVLWEKDFISGEIVHSEIFNSIHFCKPSMFESFGVGELRAFCRYVHITERKFSLINFLFRNGEPGWWTRDIKDSMPIYNGFFPATEDNLNRFGKLMLQDVKEVDMLGSWLSQEVDVARHLEHVKRADLLDFEPFFSTTPWTVALRNKNVLVIHPFAETIRNQYARKELIFSDCNILPDFNLITIKAVQSLAGENGGFSDWFEALSWMKNQMDKVTYDVAIIGCGAYGFPLAAHAKRMGKVAIHLGGSTQILFGIKGARWEGREIYRKMMNEYWVKPSKLERPKGAHLVEDACYW